MKKKIVVGIIILIAGSGLFLFFSSMEEIMFKELMFENFPTEESTKEETPSCSGNAGCLEGTVTRIIDGDTVVVDEHKIRLSLTDTPETYEEGFQEATAFTRNLCPEGSRVMVDQDDKQLYDIYDRLLGKVFCGDKILNAELLYNGHAKISTQYCSTSEFSNEDWARQYGC